MPYIAPRMLSTTTLFLLLTSVSSSISGVPLGTPHAKVVALDASNVQLALQDPANPHWLLKFYAPWCGHCKKLAPVLDEVAPTLEGKLAIGKIDCTSPGGKPLCKEHSIRGYPTLKVAVDGEILFDYPGGRTAGAITQFATTLHQPPVTQMASVADLMKAASDSEEEAEKKKKKKGNEAVRFVAYVPTSSGSSEQEPPLIQVFQQVARKQRGVAHFVHLDSSAPDVATLTKETSSEKGVVCRIEGDGQAVPPRCWTGDQLDTTTLLGYVQDYSVPTVAALGPHNFAKIGKRGKPLIIGVVDVQTDAATAKVQADLLSYATTGAARDEYVYGWLDGRQWNKFLSQFNATVMPQIFCYDLATKTYWQNGGNDVAALVQAMQDGSLPAQSAGPTAWQNYLNRAYSWLVDYRPWSIILVVVVIMMIAVGITMLVSPPVEQPGYEPSTIPPLPNETKEDDEPKDDKGKPLESKKDK